MVDVATEAGAARVRATGRPEIKDLTREQQVLYFGAAQRRREASVRTQGRIRSQMQSMFAGMGQGTLMQRGFQALRDINRTMDPSLSAEERRQQQLQALGRATGGVMDDEAAGRLLKAMSPLLEAATQAEGVLGGEGTSEARMQALKDFRRSFRASGTGATIEESMLKLIGLTQGEGFEFNMFGRAPTQAELSDAERIGLQASLEVNAGADRAARTFLEKKGMKIDEAAVKTSRQAFLELQKEYVAASITDPEKSLEATAEGRERTFRERFAEFGITGELTTAERAAAGIMDAQPVKLDGPLTIDGTLTLDLNGEELPVDVDAKSSDTSRTGG
jgi:hypothetical protein